MPQPFVILTLWLPGWMGQAGQRPDPSRSDFPAGKATEQGIQHLGHEMEAGHFLIGLQGQTC